MTEREVAELIKQTVTETVEQLSNQGLLRPVSDFAYKNISNRLRRLYEDGAQDEELRQALKQLEQDKYFNILPLFFGYNYTIESIAESFEVEVSTISRNKKRLCLELYAMTKS